MARIFVIDDDEQLLRMVGLMLERGGHSLTLINDPRNGLQQLEEDKPDLLVLDVMMPGMSGHELTREIRKSSRLKNLPVLILTARAQEIDRDTALASGANGYLSKPVTSQDLLERVDALLGEKSDKEPPPPPTKTAVPSSQNKGMILAFYGLRGGVGQTTLATNLALALRQTSKQDVCLVDMSPSCSQVAIHLNLHKKSPRGWADLLTQETLDWFEIDAHLLTHETGLRVLAAPAIPMPPSTLSAEDIVNILSVLRDKMMFTVLDLPPVLSQAFTAALKMADVSLHVITPDIVSVRTAVRTARALAELNVKPKQPSFILNQTTKTAPLPSATVERAVSGRIPFQLEFDPRQAQALNKSSPLALSAPDSSVAVVVQRMASVIWKRMAAKKGLA